MKIIRKWIRLYFGFSRAESNGFILLIPLLIIILFSEPVYRSLARPANHDFSTEKATLDSLAEVLNNAKPIEHDSRTAISPSIQLHSFDPNNAPVEELIGLGFTNQTAGRVVRYRDKGGNFRIKKDLLKIYGMDSLHFVTLAPYITLPESIITAPKAKADKITPEVKLFDINTADTLQLKSIYGIGTVLATRIFRFREKLGGFVSPNQLYEVYGLDSAVVVKLLERAYFENDFIPEQINLNVCSEIELSAHPYISKPIAKAIVAYRFQHGHFNSVDDIRKIKLIDAAIFSKISPYLTTALNGNNQKGQ